MSQYPLAALALMGFCGAAFAQGEANPAFAAHRQAVEAFCSSHAQDCADLKQLHQTARQTCQNAQSSIGDCKAAREAARAKQQALEAEGFPAPPAGRGMRGNHDDAGGPPPN